MCESNAHIAAAQAFDGSSFFPTSFSCQCTVSFRLQASYGQNGASLGLKATLALVVDRNDVDSAPFWPSVFFFFLVIIPLVLRLRRSLLMLFGKDSFVFYLEWITCSSVLNLSLFFDTCVYLLTDFVEWRVQLSHLELKAAPKSPSDFGFNIITQVEILMPSSFHRSGGYASISRKCLAAV